MAAYPDLDLCASCGEKFKPEQVCDDCRRTRLRDRLLWLPGRAYAAWLVVFGDIRHGHLSLECSGTGATVARAATPGEARGPG